MGLYSDDAIHGIRIITFVNSNVKILYQVKNGKNLHEARTFYDGLINKTNLFFQVYNEYSSTYSEGTYMDWREILLDEFLQIT